jgi:hypothetical protein
VRLIRSDVIFEIRLWGQWRSQGLNFCRGGEQTFLRNFERERQRGKQSMGVREHACFTGKILTFFHSLQRYFTYFRTRFEEKLQPQKAIFMSPNVVRSKKNIFSCKTLYCTHEYNRKIAPCLCFWRVNYIVIKNWTLTAAVRVNSSSNVLSTTTGIFLLQVAPFTVRSTPDFRNTNGTEQKTVTWLFWTVLTTPIFE